jgi:hypothetical protein
MARVIVGMTMSLEGFVADPSGSVERLYPDLDAICRRSQAVTSESTRAAPAD